MKTQTVKGNPKDLVQLKENARYMKHEEFQRLVQNIREDGCLTSHPLVYPEENGELIILSGNHRVAAAIEAGLEEIEWIQIEEHLTDAKKIAMQLSHNALVGHDDMDILKSLYEQIDDMNLKMYSGLDDKTLELMDKASPDSIGEASLETKMVSLIFLPSDLEKAKEELEKATKLTASDERWLMYGKDYDNYMDSIEATQAAYGIKNTATAFSLIMDMFSRNIIQLQEGYIDGPSKDDSSRWVPLATILGNSKIPQGAAKVLIKAVEKLKDSGEVSKDNLWQALEYLAADYLAGK
jgi:hypothetical protein